MAAREKVLRIFNVTMSDSGEYTCENPGQDVPDCGRLTLTVYGK